MKKFLVWTTSVLIAHLVFHTLRILFLTEHYFWFSILLTLVHDYFDRWRSFFVTFFVLDEVKHEQ